LIFGFLFFVFSIHSQDLIFFKNGEVLNFSVLEKSDREIVYSLLDTYNSPIIRISSYSGSKIIFRNGYEMKLTPDLIRMQKRFGIGGGFMLIDYDYFILKMYADYFLSPGFSIEGNLFTSVDGDEGGITLGAKYYFAPDSPNRLKAYTGLMIGVGFEELLIQVPFGINYVGRHGFDFRLGFDMFYAPGYYYWYDGLVLLPQMTLGWRF
jgi:hypothetical protein